MRALAFELELKFPLELKLELVLGSGGSGFWLELQFCFDCEFRKWCERDAAFAWWW